MKTFHKFSFFTSVCGLFLIFAGALVTSTGSGLSVPDWPLSFGTFFPNMTGGVFYEHGHRLVAGFVAILTLIQAIWAWRKIDEKIIRGLAIGALGAVVLQAVLGGMTVLFQLPTWISMSHAFLGQTFVAILWLITLFSSNIWKQITVDREKRTLLPHLSLIFLLLVFLQLFLGAWMRHIGAGLAIPDFPTSQGTWIPHDMNYWVKVHFAHRLGALCIFLYCIGFSVYGFLYHEKPKMIRALVLLILGLVLTQVGLGASVIWSGKNALITSFHVLCGAAILCSIALLTATAFRSFDRQKSYLLFLDYLSLGKPRITLMVCMTAFVGYDLASSVPNYSRLFWTILSVFLVSFGSCSLNQVIEVGADQAMDRTKHRPLAAGRLTILQGMIVSGICVLLGLLIMWFQVNMIATFFLLVSFFGYIFFYTPLKKITTLNTLVGAIPGALPPVIGWVAVTGELSYRAFLLFIIMFLWQLPHFLAIAWLFADDYKKAKMRMLPVQDISGGMTTRQALLYAIALLPIGLIPSFVGMAGKIYFFTTLLVTLWFIKVTYRFFQTREKADARKVMLASFLYLPVVFIFMILDRT